MDKEYIPNKDLKRSDVPDADAEWQTIWQFAHLYHPWVDQRVAGDLANAIQKHHYLHGVYPQNLHALRVCLWFEWRRYRHFGWNPLEDRGGKYVRGLVRTIQTLLTAENIPQ